MIMLYYITRIITVFGTELRTFLEHIMCRAFSVPIEDSRAFKESELCGHVEHELTENTAQAFFICFVPFLVNLVFGSLMLLSGSYLLFYVKSVSLEAVVTFWLGFSLVANVAPSFEDVLSLKDKLYGKTNIILKIVFSPIFGVLYVLSFSERYSITFILAAAYSVAFPYALSAVIF